jgi:hypothetical protein
MYASAMDMAERVCSEHGLGGGGGGGAGQGAQPSGRGPGGWGGGGGGGGGQGGGGGCISPFMVTLINIMFSVDPSCCPSF